MQGASAGHAERRGSKGFTLIELLVVVAIIALLISILLPSLGAARKQARAVKCAANLRDVGQAFGIYLTENNAVYPPGYIYPYDWQGNYDFGNQPPDHPFGYLHWSWFLYQSGNVKPDIFTCPEFLNQGAQLRHRNLKNLRGLGFGESFKGEQQEGLSRERGNI